MAKEKPSFILYADLTGRIEHLTNEEKGVLFQHLLDYVNDLNPTLEDRILIGVWKPIEQQLKRDLEKYEDKKDKKSISGREGNLKRWNLDLFQDYKNGKHTLEDAETIAKGRKVSHTDKVQSQKVANIAVNDNVNVNVNDINKYINNPTKVEPINFDILLNYINEKTNRSFRTINKNIQAKYKARLKDGYTKKDIQTAIDNAVKSDYHKANGFKYLTPEFFSRADKIDLYSQTTEKEYVSPEQQRVINVMAEIERVKNLSK